MLSILSAVQIAFINNKEITRAKVLIVSNEANIVNNIDFTIVPSNIAMK